MIHRHRFGLRARFLAAGSLLVLTTVAASTWTWLVLSQLATMAENTVRDTDETTAAAADLTSALEREDDALLVVLGGAPDGRTALEEARRVTDGAQTRLIRDLAASSTGGVASTFPSLVLAYRQTVDDIVLAPGEEPLERYHLEANPHLRAAVTAIRATRDRQFDAARAATARAFDQVKRARGVVLLISVFALAIAVLVALRLAQRVIQPLRQLSRGAGAIRDGNFEARIADVPADEIGQVANAFNEMAGRLAEFHRSNLGEVMRAKHALEATLRALPDAVLLLDEEDRVVSMNPAAEDLFRAAGRPLPRTAQDLVTLTPNSARLQEALLQPPPFDRVDLQTALRLDGNGQVRRLLPRVVPLAPGEAHGGVVVVFSDVTDIVRLDEMRTELIAVASHELQTPVTTLRMSLLMLRESTEQLDERIRDLVRTALGGVDQLGETVAELLDMTRIEAGWLKLSREPVLLNDIVREVVARCQPEADEIGIHLKCSADAGVPLIDGDRARLRMVVENIVHNALKYTPRGGCIEVSTSVERTIPPAGQPGRVVVQVTDNGPGIPLELRNRVFEKFFRVEHYRPGSEDAPRGSGIGLYLCKEIIELHGGSIQCDAAPGGRGTRVVFDLPAPTLGGRE